ncbi:hypothetical protein [Leucothrix mucor]|uniref:hypothetical protein n=1 Tax=Leucothrix mucor TaxID=45248 RepID=UPI0003B5CE9F|nr:hypothetical protein [Leucothrix mucor]
MRYIPLGDADQESLKDWKERSLQILDELKNEPDKKKRKVIIKRCSSHWREPVLLSFLKGLSDGKCWYSEAKFTAEYPHLEHFRPKSCAFDESRNIRHDGYWWLAFDLENYRLSKPVPNTKKSAYFPLKERSQAVLRPGIALSREVPMFLDPTNQLDVDLISFNALGEPEPCSEPVFDLDEWDRQRIKFSISFYGLDNYELCNERKELWVSLFAQFDEYAKYYQKYKEENCIESRGKAKQIFGRLTVFLKNPSQEFTGLIKACFNAHKVGKALLKTTHF